MVVAGVRQLRARDRTVARFPVEGAVHRLRLGEIDGIRALLVHAPLLQIRRFERRDGGERPARFKHALILHRGVGGDVAFGKALPSRLLRRIIRQGGIVAIQAHLVAVLVHIGKRIVEIGRSLKLIGEPLDRLAVGRVLRRLRKSGEPANRNRGRSQQRRENRPRNARRLALLRLPCRLRRSHSAQKVAPAFLAFRLPCENGKESPQAPFPSCRQPPQLPGAPAAPRYLTRRRAATRAAAPPATPMAPSAHATPCGSPVVASFLRLWSSFPPSGSGSGPGSGAT